MQWIGGWRSATVVIKRMRANSVSVNKNAKQRVVRRRRPRRQQGKLSNVYPITEESWGQIMTVVTVTAAASATAAAVAAAVAAAAAAAAATMVRDHGG
jgi:hypothetical protein